MRLFWAPLKPKMMRGEKIFSQEGDLLDDLLGSRVIVAGVLPETGTVLDDFHYVDQDFRIRSEKRIAITEGSGDLW